MSLLRTKTPLLLTRYAASQPFSTAPNAQTLKLERIADDLLALTKTERHDYSILFRLKLGLNQYGGGIQIASPGSIASESSKPAEEVKEKTAFDVKLEKFDAAAKIKVIKEVRAFTTLGLKEAKELVEKAPVLVKQGVTKEEAEQIVVKLKEAGATVVME